jgi:hypothetical protein
MLEKKQTIKETSGLSVIFQIKLTVAVFKRRKIIYKNEIIVSTKYRRKLQAQKHIQQEIERRLRNSYFFLSPHPDYDIVKYSDMASCNTYLKYKIIEKLV